MSLQNAYIRLNTKWASKLGALYQQYRVPPPDAPPSEFPSSPGIAGTLPVPSPIGPEFNIGSLSALFDASISLSFNAPSKFDNSLFAAIISPSAVEPLDFLVGQEGIFFVASKEPLKPILCIQCNRMCDFYRPSGDAPRPSFYSGDIASARIKLASGIPLSELQGTKGERNAAEQLPTDSRMQWSIVLVPSLPGLTLRQADRMTDDLGRNFVISAVELSDLGWRLTAELTDV